MTKVIRKFSNTKISRQTEQEFFDSLDDPIENLNNSGLVLPPLDIKNNYDEVFTGIVPESFAMDGVEYKVKDIDSDDQYIAIKKIIEWLYTNPQKRQPFLRLSGYAGTGKGIVISYLLHMANELFPSYMKTKSIAVCTFTWKAALVLRSRGISQASSIHSIFYSIDEDTTSDEISDDDEEEKENIETLVNGPSFQRRPPEEIRAKYSLIVIDEAGMVNYKIRQDLEAIGVPILYVGDGGQLPAISDDPKDMAIDAKFMTDAELNLVNIRRQALDSPIIRLSIDVRNGKWIPYGKYGEGVFKVNYEELTDKIILSSDQMICGKNDTRRFLNDEYRKLKGYHPKSMPNYGEKLIGIDNIPSRGMFNGQVWFAEESYSHFKNRLQSRNITMKIKEEGTNRVKLNKCIFPDDQIYNDGTNRKRVNHFIRENEIYPVDYGYAITAHKSQGSSYMRPVCFEERLGNKDFHKRWLYTVVTRAVKKLIISDI